MPTHAKPTFSIVPGASAHPMAFVLEMAEDDDPNRASKASNREAQSEE
jgi:hypothetical protein